MFLVYVSDVCLFFVVCVIDVFVVNVCLFYFPFYCSVLIIYVRNVNKTLQNKKKVLMHSSGMGTVCIK